MKKIIYLVLLAWIMPLMAHAQGWPANYQGVMLQGFYWDSFDDSQWTTLQSKSGDIAGYFDLVWLPQSANCGGKSMGYDDLYWFNDYNSSFGTAAQLRSLISTYKSYGIGTIADVVINHRKTLSNWVDFPAETYRGVNYQLLSTDIASNDDGGKTKAWANANGYSVSNNIDSGTDWDGMRDLDHYSGNVQSCVKAYLNMLLNDLGYAGFRYDMVKGYRGSFTGIYNEATNPAFSVGEYWDGNPSAVKNWLNMTKRNDVIMSAAFDFPFRYTVRDAANYGNWSKLANASIMSDPDYRRYAVTFIENHDTEYRSSSSQQDPIKKDTLAANAFMLAMPGTPCVFYKHYLAYGQEIKAMIDLRKLAGIDNQSTYTTTHNSTGYYGAATTGNKSQLMVLVGNTAGVDVTAPWVEVLSGYHYKYFLPATTEMAWPDKASGEYPGTFQVKLTAVSAHTGATLVYTTDGNDPTPSSTQVASGATINIDKDCTLKVALLNGGAVSGMVTRNYTIKTVQPFVPHDITIYLKDPTTAPNNWSLVNFYCWDNKGNQVSKAWPGTTITNTTVIDGTRLYYCTYTINAADHYLNFVFNQGSSNGQTVDIERIKQDTYFEIASQTNKYTVNDITSQFAPTQGDINGDHIVNVSDVTALINKILGTASFDDAICDIDGNGAVNVSDVTALINIILGR